MQLNRKSKGVILAVLSLILVGSAAAQKRPWTDMDPFRIRSIGNLQLSPAGDHVFFVVSGRSVPENRSHSMLYSMPTAGGTPVALTDANDPISSPHLSPDGKQIAFFASDKEGLGLWVMNADGSGRRKITPVERTNAYLAMPGNDISWSPDGKRIAYVGAGPRHYTNDPSPQNPPNGNEPMIVDRLLYKSIYYYSDLRRRQVFVTELATGYTRQITPNDTDYHAIAWSPDGDWIVATANLTGQDDYNSNDDLVLLSPAIRRSDTELNQGDNDSKAKHRAGIQLTNTVGPEYTPSWSPDGKQIAYLARVRDWRSKESDAEFPKIFVASVDTANPALISNPVDLTSALDKWISSFTWSRDGKRIYATAQDHGKIVLYAIDVATRKATPLIDERGQVSTFAQMMIEDHGQASSFATNSELLYVYTDFEYPPELYRANADGQERKKLTEFNAAMEQLDTIAPQHFEFASFDGTPVEGWIVPPRGARPGQKYPMVLEIHGGPHGQYGYTFAGIGKYERFSATGYAVAFMNPRGSSGYGQKFSDACVNDLGGGDYKDLMAGVDYILAHYPFVDGNRMGITGVSYGGYMSDWIITQTNRFKAAVPVSGISNLVSGYGITGNFLWPESDMTVRSYDDMDRLWAVSPLKYVKNAKTPTLFIHGVWDNMTTLNQAEEMFMAMKRMGQTAVMAIYPNEGHGVANQPAHTHDYYERSLKWFDQYLK